MRHYIHYPKATPTTTWTPSSIAGAYNFPKITDGTTQTIGIIELDQSGYNPSDIQTAFQTWGLPMPILTDVSVDGGTNSPGTEADGEVVLDIEMAAAIYSYCTGQAANIRVYFAPNSN